MDATELSDELDSFVNKVHVLDTDGVAGDLIENLEGHIATAKMRLGFIVERITNHQKEG